VLGDRPISEEVALDAILPADGEDQRHCLEPLTLLLQMNIRVWGSPRFQAYLLGLEHTFINIDDVAALLEVIKVGLKYHQSLLVYSLLLGLADMIGGVRGLVLDAPAGIDVPQPAD